MNAVRLSFLIASVAFFSGCAFSAATAPLATGDYGPKPRDPGRVIAAWLNSRCLSISRGPFTASELIMSDPTEAAIMSLTGRKAGWQVILGPENSKVVDCTEVGYTRVIMNRDRVISVTSSSFPF